MKLTYETQKDPSGRRYKCMSEERRQDFLGFRTLLYRGVSDWHFAKGAAKLEAIQRLERVDA